MGVSGLWAFLKKYPELFEDVRLSDYSGKCFGIDTSIFMHRFGYDNPHEPPVTEFLDQARELQGAGITPVYIFDGKRDPAKVYEAARRKEAGEKLDADAAKRAEYIARIDNGEAIGAADAGAPADVRRLAEAKDTTVDVAGFGAVEIEFSREIATAEIRARCEKESNLGGGRLEIPDSHYHALMAAFDAEGIGYYIAKNDAERLGALLTLNGTLDVLVTDDGDALAFGATSMLRNLFRMGASTMQLIRSEAVYTALNLTREQFVDLCIMAGCDYTQSNGIPSVGPAGALKILQKHGALKTYLDSPDWEKKRVAVAKRFPDFDPEQLREADARAVFMSTAPQVGYVSKTIDPDAEQAPREYRGAFQSPPPAKRFRASDSSRPVF